MLIRIGGAAIDCWEAHSPDEHSVGLSDTAELDDGQGMIFVYGGMSHHSFWMPESMKFPIDIIFINDQCKIEAIYDGCQPGTDGYNARAQWVLEVPAYFCERHGITPGDKVLMDTVVEGTQSSDLLRSLSTASKEARSRCIRCQGLDGNCKCGGRCPECTAHEAGEHIVEGCESTYPRPSTKKAATLSPMDVHTSMVAQASPKLMTVDEFIELGLLQEVNRLVLHPMGLAISAVIPDDGSPARFESILDYRDDPVGMIFEKVDAIKSDRVEQMHQEKSGARMKDLGYHIQPAGPVGMGQIAQSTETAPYDRAPSTAPSRPTERFMEHDTFDNQIPEGGPGVSNGPIHDEEWNSPTRAATMEDIVK